jgi:hypothetical protein
MGTPNEARKYFAPFYCSICQMTLEMGLTGKLDGLSGYMTTALCDTLRAASQNWRAGVGNRADVGCEGVLGGRGPVDEGGADDGTDGGVRERVVGVSERAEDLHDHEQPFPCVVARESLRQQRREPRGLLVGDRHDRLLPPLNIEAM